MYIDANVFIFAAIDSGSKGEVAAKILSEVPRGETALTTPLALDEVMWVVRRQKGMSTVREIVEDIFKIPDLQIEDVPSDIAFRALEYMEEYNLKPRDAHHVALMDYYGETVIASDDKDFDKIKHIKRLALD